MRRGSAPETIRCATRCGEGVGLAGSCTRDDEKWRRRIKRVASVFDGAALFGIELVEVCCGHGRPATPREARPLLSKRLCPQPI